MSAAGEFMSAEHRKLEALFEEAIAEVREAIRRISRLAPPPRAKGPSRELHV